MSWNGSGNFNRLFSWTADALAAIDITASRMDSDTNDITSNGFGNTLTRDGQGSATANLPMNGFKHTNVGNATAANQYAAFGQLNNNEGIAGGRLTLVTATPVLIANETAIGTIFYTPFVHDFISLYNGTNWAMYQFTEQSVTLDTGNFLSTKLYDLFMFLNSGVPTLGYGPAWTNTTTRSAAISRLNGVWTNTSTITLRQNSSTTFSPNANQATYVGTARATANGQTSMTFQAAASAGGGNVLGIYNAYNQVLVSAVSNDSKNGGWTYAVATWRAADNSASNAISFVDGLGTTAVNALHMLEISAGGGFSALGVAINWTSGAPNCSAGTSLTGALTMASPGSFLPVLGYNTVTALEFGNASASTSAGGNGAAIPWMQQLQITLQM